MGSLILNSKSVWQNSLPIYWKINFYAIFRLKNRLSSKFLRTDFKLLMSDPKLVLIECNEASAEQFLEQKALALLPEDFLPHSALHRLLTANLWLFESKFSLEIISKRSIVSEMSLKLDLEPIEGEIFAQLTLTASMMSFSCSSATPTSRSSRAKQ